jgi:hypothetical protein
MVPDDTADRETIRTVSWISRWSVEILAAVASAEVALTLFQAFVVHADLTVVVSSTVIAASFVAGIAITLSERGPGRALDPL